MCKQQQWQKNIFPTSVVCLAKAMLIATGAAFSKLLLLMLREHRPTNDQETVRAPRCHLGHAASAGAQHQLQPAVTLLWAKLLNTLSHLKWSLKTISYSANES